MRDGRLSHLTWRQERAPSLSYRSAHDLADRIRSGRAPHSLVIGKSRGLQGSGCAIDTITSSNRHIAFEHDAVEIAQLTHVIVAVCLMQQTAVVPHNEIARTPAVPVLISRLCSVLE